jgi:hypothetical protein
MRRRKNVLWLRGQKENGNNFTFQLVFSPCFCSLPLMFENKSCASEHVVSPSIVRLELFFTRKELNVMKSGVEAKEFIKIISLI